MPKTMKPFRFSRATSIFFIIVIIGITIFCVHSCNSEADEKLLTAAAMGTLEQVNTALKEGARINARDWDIGNTALMFAAGRGNFPIVKRLVEAGANLKLSDAGGNALYWACTRKHTDVVTYLISAGSPLIADEELKQRLKQDQEAPAVCK